MCGLFMERTIVVLVMFIFKILLVVREVHKWRIMLKIFDYVKWYQMLLVFTRGVQSQQNVVEPPNDEAKRFYESLESASRPLYEGSMHSELSVAVRLLTIKSDWNISQAGMNAIIGLMSEVSPSINLPNDYYNAKKLVSKLGLSSTKIDCCENGCMLYYKDDAALEACKFCGLSCFKEVTNAKGRKVAVKKMHYLPICGLCLYN
nr:uncharacterized protein LOC108944053 isoform X2 [Nicotiana tomentosiformis]